MEVIARKYGNPVFLNKQGKPAQLNERYWAALYARLNDILYEPDEREFYLYDGSSGLFRIISVDFIRGQLDSLVRKLFPDYSRLATELNLRGVIAFLRTETEERDAFKNHGDFVHLANGILKFDNGRFVLEDFSPSFLSRNQSPVSYDCDAEAPEFIEFLKPLCDDDKTLVRKYFGQLLFGRNITQTILLLDGESATGKSTLTKIMRNIVGEQNCYELRTALLADRFELGRYIGKTFLVAPDVDARFLSTQGASLLKPLVGGDPLPAELKQRNSRFTVPGVFNVVITSNCRLRVRLQGDNEAWRRRLLIVRYENTRNGRTIPDYDKVLVEKEGSGILNFALRGLEDAWRDIAENGGRFKLAKIHNARVDKLLNESDSLRVFLKDSIAVEARRDLTAAEILEQYYRDCIDEELSPVPLSDARKILDSLMMELFGVSRSGSILRDGKNQRGFSGVRFRND
jgi:phage/plasmid-associated DNA primase